MTKLYYTMKEMQYYFWPFFCAPLTFLVTATFLSYHTAPTPFRHGWNQGFQKCLLMAIAVPLRFWGFFVKKAKWEIYKYIMLSDLAQTEADPMQLESVILAVTVT